MLKHAYLLAKIGADTAENERNFAEDLQLPYGCCQPACRSRPPGAPRSRGDGGEDAVRERLLLLADEGPHPLLEALRLGPPGVCQN